MSKRLNCKFYDINNEIVKIYGSIDNFSKNIRNDYDRFDKKEELMLKILFNIK